MILKNKILFVADYDNKSGNGHLHRCLKFSELFKKNYECYFLTKKSFKVSHINHYNINKLEDKNCFSFIIIDSYKIKKKLLLVLRKKTKCIININDDYKNAFNSDFLINYSNEEKNKNLDIIKNKKIKNKLLGKKYNFIFPTKKIQRKKKNLRLKIFIYLGTKPQKKIIDNILNSLSNLKEKIDLVLISPIKFKVKENINIVVQKELQKNFFLNEIYKSDIIICSTGVIVYEAISAKKITFGIPISENQKNNYNELTNLKLIFSLKNFQKIILNKKKLENQKKFLSKNHYLRQYNHMFNIKQKLFPLENKFKEKFKIEEFSLSKKSIKDLYNLQTKENRRFFINKEQFGFKFHKDYLYKFYENPYNIIFFIKLKKMNIGYIKMTLIEKYYDCSIILQKSYRNYGFSSQSLKFLKNNQDFFNYKLKAKILSTNKSSIKVFEKAGFKKNKDLFLLDEK